MYYYILGNRGYKYRYYKGNVYAITNWNYGLGCEGRHPNELDLDNIPESLERRLSVSVKYTKNNGNQDTAIVKATNIYRIYLLNELDRLEEDIRNLNEIYDLKLQQKRLLQNYIDKKLENWNYRGEINL